MPASGRNVRLVWAWQSAFNIAADNTATAWTFNAEAGNAGPIGTQGPEVRNLMGLNGDAIDPEQGPHDVAGPWEIPMDARQLGLWIRGLCGNSVSAAATGSRGGFLFKAQPAVNDTLTVGPTTFTWVSGAPVGNQIQIGADLLASVDNAQVAVDAETNISATDKGSILFVQHDTADQTGDTFVTSTSQPARVQAFAATLKGGGYTRHVWTDTQNAARPFASIEIEHTDVTGAYQFRLLDGHMIRSLAFPKQRSGQGTVTVDALARLDNPGSARTLTASPTQLDVMAFSFLGGSILFDGVCVGTIDSAGVTLGQELTAEGFEACAAGDVAVIGEPVIGETTAAVELTGRFPTPTLHDAAFNASAVACEMFYINRGTGAVLTLHLPRVFLSRPGVTYNGRGTVTAAFTGNGMKDLVAGYRYQAELFTPVTAYS